MCRNSFAWRPFIRFKFVGLRNTSRWGRSSNVFCSVPLRECCGRAHKSVVPESWNRVGMVVLHKHRRRVGITPKMFRVQHNAKRTIGLAVQLGGRLFPTKGRVRPWAGYWHGRKFLRCRFSRRYLQRRDRIQDNKPSGSLTRATISLAGLMEETPWAALYRHPMEICTGRPSCWCEPLRGTVLQDNSVRKFSTLHNFRVRRRRCPKWLH